MPECVRFPGECWLALHGGSLDLRCLQRKDASKQLAAPAEASMLVSGSLSLLYNKFVKD